MKRKLLILFFGFVLFISCKHKATLNDHVAEVPAEPIIVQEKNDGSDLKDEEKREIYLRSLMDSQSYFVDDEKIEKDVLNVLHGLKGNSETSFIAPSLQKVNNNLFELDNLSFFSVDGEDIEENIKLSLYKIGDGKKSGFAITCNDLRIGEILALVEEGEFNEDDPFMQIISSNIRTYVNATVQDWYELKKKKESEYKQKSIWEGLVSSGKYRYENWKINDKDFKPFLIGTRWNQNPIYNDVIVKLKGGNFPAGCVTVAIAQIMAFHGYPENYYGTRWENFDAFKRRVKVHFPVAEKWNGKYNWRILRYATEIDVAVNYPIYPLQIASLMYEIAESGNASYDVEKGTGMNIEDYTKSLLFHDYITGVCTRTPMETDPNAYIGHIMIPPPWVIDELRKNPPICRYPFSKEQAEIKNDNEIKSIGPHGKRIRYTNYSFDKIKSSIDNLCPVLIKGRAINKRHNSTMSLGQEFQDVGHAWVIDGYCNLTCDAIHEDTKEKETITADYVHCNVGWGGDYNGYYISNVFTFGTGGKATAEDQEIRSSWNGQDNHYRYEIKIFPNLIPKNKLGTYSEYPWHYNWRALW